MWQLKEGKVPSIADKLCGLWQHLFCLLRWETQPVLPSPLLLLGALVPDHRLHLQQTPHDASDAFLSEACVPQASHLSVPLSLLFPLPPKSHPSFRIPLQILPAPGSLPDLSVNIPVFMFAKAGGRKADASVSSTVSGTLLLIPMSQALLFCLKIPGD